VNFGSPTRNSKQLGKYSNIGVQTEKGEATASSASPMCDAETRDSASTRIGVIAIVQDELNA